MTTELVGGSGAQFAARSKTAVAAAPHHRSVVNAKFLAIGRLARKDHLLP
jgi:hypothetical protein